MVNKENKILFVDLDICSRECPECVVDCSYYYHTQEKGNGITNLREFITYNTICRKCEEPHCVSACRYDALKKKDDGTLVRHSMRCASCKSCSTACPYGTIYPELISFKFQACDLCQDRRDDGKNPVCIKTCPYSALALKDKKDVDQENTFMIGDQIMAHSKHWQRERI